MNGLAIEMMKQEAKRLRREHASALFGHKPVALKDLDDAIRLIDRLLREFVDGVRPTGQPESGSAAVPAEAPAPGW